MISNNSPKIIYRHFLQCKNGIRYCLHGTIDLPHKGVIYKLRFKSHAQKCLSLDMEHRLCFPFCQGHYGRMQSHGQEIQFEMSYNLQSTINHTP